MYRSGISEAKGDKLLDVIHVIMGRHNKLLPIGHTWKGIKAAIRRKSRGVFKIKEFTYSLPKRFFGEVDSKGNPWIPVVAYGLDLRYVLAKALLDVNPVLFAFRWKQQTYGDYPQRVDVMDKDEKDTYEMNGIDVLTVPIPDEDQVLSNFSTGSYFRKLTEDADQYPLVGGKKPIHICLSIFSDKSQATQTSSEQPVVFSILNSIGTDYKMIFAGYAPLSLPYTDEVSMSELLILNMLTN